MREICTKALEMPADEFIRWVRRTFDSATAKGASPMANKLGTQASA